MTCIVISLLFPDMKLRKILLGTETIPKSTKKKRGNISKRDNIFRLTPNKLINYPSKELFYSNIDSINECRRML